MTESAGRLLGKPTDLPVRAILAIASNPAPGAHGVPSGSITPRTEVALYDFALRRNRLAGLAADPVDSLTFQGTKSDVKLQSVFYPYLRQTRAFGQQWWSFGYSGTCTCFVSRQGLASQQPVAPGVLLSQTGSGFLLARRAPITLDPQINTDLLKFPFFEALYARKPHPVHQLKTSP